MKFSENWLRTFVDPPYSSDELAHALTMAGLEVEAVEPVASDFDKVVVAEVLSVAAHPSADRLQVCLVNIGHEGQEPIQIVCGAPNVRAGVKVPCALIGARLSDFVIKQAKLRGELSCGMLCSSKELGLSEVADGLLLLPDDAPVGEDFRDYYALDDRLFTLSLTPNRADCLGVSGVAREVAAITASNFIPLSIDSINNEIDDVQDVRIIAPEACPLYCGRIVRSVNLNVATPLWMVQRLERSGLRTINAIVDITNYVMLETGQPLHAFDLGKLTGAIQIRYARPNERIQLLNGSQIDLAPDMLLIADASQPLALAGIMGGMDSGVTEGTTDIFLESAFFSPDAISGKSFVLGFSSDSAHRFERGVDYAATRDVLERTTQLVQMICGGNVGPVTEVKHVLPQRATVMVRAERVQRVLGVNIEQTKINEFFQRLQLDFSVDGNMFSVTPPSYRFDLEIEEDFIEEIARLHGYDCIPSNAPSADLVMLEASETNRSVTQIKQTLVNRDYQEVINYAFVDASWETDFIKNKDPISLKNPIASQMNVMRSSLIGGLIANLRFNLNRKQTRVRLFEMGCCFERSEKSGCKQVEKLAGLCYGDAVVEQWGESSRDVDFYDVKADIEALFWPQAIHFVVFEYPALHPGKSAQICIEDRTIGWLGELHPHWQKQYDLPRSTILFELVHDELVSKLLPVIQEVSKFPPVRRDIAIVVNNEVSVDSLLTCMFDEKNSIISDIALFDIYRGKGMENNKKSLAFRVLLQDTNKTLTDEEADIAIAGLIKVLEKKFDATLRN